MTDRPCFDVTVVGAGPLGAATARHLAERGASVLVVGPEEPAGFTDHQGVWAGHYDQGRLGHVLEVPLVTSLLAARSMRRFAELYERSGVEFTRPVHSLAVLPDASGHPQASTWFDRDRLLRNAEDLGVAVQALDEAGLAREYPNLRVAPGHVGVVQRDAYIVNPRDLVRAELTAATRAGATLVRDEVLPWTAAPAGGPLVVTGRSGQTWHTDKIVVATGAATNALGLLPRPLQMQTYGATVVLVEVEHPESVDMPAMMYLKADGGRIGFGGIVMSPLRYPDGRWYLKVSGRSLLDNPLDSAEEIAAWVRTGGRTEDIDESLDLLTELLPQHTFGTALVRPCTVCDTPTDLPYIDLADERTTVVLEGERGVMAADEIGRLAADLTLTGRWRDSIPAELLAARWSEPTA